MKLALVLAMALPVIICFQCGNNEDCPEEHICVTAQVCTSESCYNLGKVCVKQDYVHSFLAYLQDNQKELLVQAENKKKSVEIFEMFESVIVKKWGIPALTVSTKGFSDASIKFTNGQQEFFMGVNRHTGKFVISAGGEPIVIIDGSGNLWLEGGSVVAQNLMIRGNVYHGRTKQFWLYHSEIFSDLEVPEGWSMSKGVTRCAGLYLLGGYCRLSNSPLIKRLKGIPTHTQIRLEADYHFIDAWQGEAGYLQVGTNLNAEDRNYIWTDSHDFAHSDNTINMCGGDMGESKFVSHIDATFGHEGDELILVFGSTLKADPCLASYAISTLRIYLR